MLLMMMMMMMVINWMLLYAWCACVSACNTNSYLNEMMLGWLSLRRWRMSVSRLSLSFLMATSSPFNLPRNTAPWAPLPSHCRSDMFSNGISQSSVHAPERKKTYRYTYGNILSIMRTIYFGFKVLVWNWSAHYTVQKGSRYMTRRMQTNVDDDNQAESGSSQRPIVVPTLMFKIITHTVLILYLE